MPKPDDREPRRPGRPPIDAAERRGISVTVSLTSRQYHVVTHLASEQRITVPEVIRRALPKSDDD